MNKLQKVVEFAHRKLKQHGLSDWTFELGTAKKTAGTCYTSRKMIRMSKVLINARSLEDSYNTVLHEIAHALTPFHGHDRVWKQMAKQIGAKPERCYNSSTVNKDKINYKYTGKCPNGHFSNYSRRPKLERSCGKCCSYFNRNYLIVITQNY